MKYFRYDQTNATLNIFTVEHSQLQGSVGAMIGQVGGCGIWAGQSRTTILVTLMLQI